jgi:Txe/YoeB family toxin of Txe-Axe toxin-antitoxin module
MVLEQNVNKILPNSASKNYTCQICNKEYKDNSGLWRHKKICITTNENAVSSDVDDENEKQNNVSNGLTEKLVIELIKQNKELLEIVKNGTHNNNSINTTHTNSHNKAFNLQFFLNDTCRDAMNMTDFIDSLKMELSDLINVGEKGYIEGITNIIVKNLKTLDVTKRPVHCTDKKRETVYIKDNNIWEKDEDKTRMHKLIKKVVSKNMKMFPKYREAHPDCMAYHSKFGDEYHSIVYESMGGKGDDDLEKNERIIKNILKQVVVDKGSE